MSTTIEAPKPIDGPELMQRRNEAELARRQGKEVAAVKVESAPEPETKQEEASKKRLSGESRKWRELYELRGRIKAYEELGMTPNGAKSAAKEETTAPATTEAPKRENFSTDQEFDEARIDYRAKQQAEKVIADREAANAADSDIASTMEAIKAQQDAAKEEFPDWDKVIEEGSKTKIPDNFPEFAPVLFGALLSSAKAKVPLYNSLIYRFAQEPALLVDLMTRENAAKKMEKKAGERAVNEVLVDFHELCGELRAEKRLRTAKNGDKVENKETVRASQDAAPEPKTKPAPSESLKTAGGSPAVTGKPDITKDPAGYMRWKNEQEKGAGNISRGR